MRSVWEIVRQFTELGEMLLFLFLFTDAKVSRRSRNRFFIVACIIIICTMRLVVLPGIDDERILIYEVLDFMIVWFVVDAPVGRKIVIYLFSYLYCGVMNIIVLWLISHYMMTPPVMILYEELIRGVTYTVISIGIVLLKLLWKNFVKEMKWEVSTKIYIIYVVILLSVTYYTGRIFYIESDNLPNKNALYVEVKILFVAVILFANILGLVILVGERKTYREKIYLQDELLDLQRQYYSQLMNKQEELREVRHDMKAHILQISYLYRNGSTHEFEEYLANVEVNWNCNKSMILETGNHTADVMVNYYANLATDNHIQFELVGRFGENILINEYDFCSLLFNSISNAYESCSRLNSIDSRIYIYIKNYNRTLFLTISNTYDIDNKRIFAYKTSKDNEKEHGYGMKIISKIVKKYNGKIQYEVYEGMFTLQIMLPEIY